MQLEKNQIQTVLEDIYAIEPALRRFEKELRKLVEEIIAIKPDAVFDENFRAALRSQLMARAAELSKKKGKGFFPAAIFANKFSYALAGGLAVIVILIGAGFAAQKQGLVSFDWQSLNFDDSFKKVSLGESAFGPLSFSSSGGQEQLATGKGGGGASAPTNGDTITSVPDGRGGGGLIYPAFSFKYVYKGEPIELEDSQIEVLRRRGFEEKASGFSNFLNKFGAGIIKMPSFGSLELMNFNSSNGKFMVSADIPSGSMFISEFQSRVVPVSAPVQPMKFSDIIPDNEIIRLADEFVKNHGINLKNYGEPEADNNWRIAYAQSETKDDFYVPDNIAVIYPLKINGRMVFDEGGNKSGLYVSVDLRAKKAVAANNITSQSYEASNYAAETDFAKVLEAASCGGNWSYPVPGQNVVEVEIGAPQKEYVMMSSYEGGMSRYLMVPSLVFPVLKTPDGQIYYQKNIVVPLAKDLIWQNDFQIMESQPKQ